MKRAVAVRFATQLQGLLREQLWEIQGEKIFDLLRGEPPNQDVNEYKIELEFNDDMDF